MHHCALARRFSAWYYRVKVYHLRILRRAGWHRCGLQCGRRKRPKRTYKMWFTGYLHEWNVYSWIQVYCLSICLFIKCNDIMSYCARLCLIALLNLITKYTQRSFTIWTTICWFAFVCNYICKHLSKYLLHHFSIRYGVYKNKRRKIEKKNGNLSKYSCDIACCVFSFFNISYCVILYDNNHVVCVVSISST